MTELRVPKLNNNDTEYLLVEWLAEDGAGVVKGDPVVVLETSKAAEELMAEADGVLRRTAETGATCRPGDVIAHISDGSAPPPSATDPGAATDGTAAPPAADGSAPPPAADPGPIVTAPAQALIDEHGVDPARIRALGKKVIKRADVLALLETGTGDAQPLPPVQRAVAAAVTRSHQTIPAAFTAVKLDAGPAIARARALGKEARALIGLPELLVAAVASLHGQFPMCFAEPVGADPLAVRPSTAPNVGVTVDVGHGLYVPVLRDAGRLSVKEIAERLAAYRTKAAQGAFREDDLAGGNIVVTLHTDTAVLLAVPIVFPGQTCALSLCAPQHEFALDPAGNVVKRTTVTLGLAFDHRLVNGREAAMFLNAIRKAITP
ncbi:2-oxo acid dehydrogenase subunit E2 [Nonomuraea angiospora]|uniref:Dihydrolipoamide acetyltransferase component of pyruvate dehydrogenase complex n=1 Tax=Nonomuraea angiospora TaxID=46172 RepID=A0ABR9LRZ5_9ACTN|nr:2-oxo acid dehydrogenase subunit E2 [Nonomuraea angiospora]MBE1583429.1 2-oxoglutarate dehydrogenase E2 component (dihydrolipoamide succinyltransferase) [Nonomuraea angiospora]